MLPPIQLELLFLLALGLAMTSYAQNTVTTACGQWRKGLSEGQKNKVTVRMMKRQSDDTGKHGQIYGKNAGRKSAYLTAGPGSCGKDYVDKDRGACLWDGTNSATQFSPGITPGWLNGTSTENCGKKFFANRGGNRATGVILDSCTLTDGPPLDLDHGCSTIYVTAITFIELGGSISTGEGRIELDDWDFHPQTPPL